MKLNKTLHPSDYDNLQSQVALFNDVTSKIDSVVHHHHRRWEYGIALAALDLLPAKALSIADIGGGGSPLPTMVASMEHNVTVIDPSYEANRQGGFNDALDILINIDNRDFMAVDTSQQYDVVFCISTLEHVQDDVAFFKKALDAAKYLVVFTVDYHVSGQPQSKHHLRTYNRASLERLAALAVPEWELVDTPSWEDHGGQVHNYNFAGLVLRRKTQSVRSLIVKGEVSDSDDTQPEKPTPKPKRTRRKKAKSSE